MSNKIAIFSSQDADGTSINFKINPREGLGVTDTEYSAYLEIFGSLGGGTLSLQKQCIDGTFRELEDETSKLATKFPSSGKLLVMPFGFKSQDGFRFVLAGATTPNLTITGINMSEV